MHLRHWKFSILEVLWDRTCYITYTDWGGRLLHYKYGYQVRVKAPPLPSSYLCTFTPYERERDANKTLQMVCF